MFKGDKNELLIWIDLVEKVVQVFILRGFSTQLSETDSMLVPVQKVDLVNAQDRAQVETSAL